jgi:hypothetical protein
VHGGFLKSYELQPVQELIAAVRQQGGGALLVTSYSLGATLAALAAVDTAPARLEYPHAPRNSRLLGSESGLKPIGGRTRDC